MSKEIATKRKRTPRSTASGDESDDDSQFDDGSGADAELKAQLDAVDQQGAALSAAEKRKKKLELNRVASRESRKRKKRRVEELQRSVLFLTHENHQLREQNELLRQMLVGRLPNANAAAAATAAQLPQLSPPPVQQAAQVTLPPQQALQQQVHAPAQQQLVHPNQHLPIQQQHQGEGVTAT